MEGNTKNAEMNLVVRGDFDLGELKANTEVTLLSKSLGEIQSLYVNGKLVAKDIKRDAPDQRYPLGHELLHSGKVGVDDIEDGPRRRCTTGGLESI